MLRIQNPVPVFLDGQGDPLDNGQIWIGVANQDPEENPIEVYWDVDLTIPAEQPLRTLAGTIRNGGTPSFAFVAEDDFSLRVADTNNAQINYTASYQQANASFQPLDSDLTAIAALGTTPFGRSLLTLANNAALISSIGGLNFLSLSGGTVTSAITRQGAGAHLFHVSSDFASGRVFTANVGDPDPTSAPGDIVFWLS